MIEVQVFFLVQVQVIVMIQGRVDRVGWGGGDGEGHNGEGEIGMGKWGGVEVLARAGCGEGRQEGLDCEEAMGRGRGQWEGGEEGARGEGISQMDMMKCLGGMRLQSFLTLFTRAVPGTPPCAH